jgi:tetratricopeptide (TPR) repeat protein
MNDRRIGLCALVWIACVLSAACDTVYEPVKDPQQREPMTVAQAREVVTATLTGSLGERVYIYDTPVYGVAISEVHATRHTLTIKTASNEQLEFSLARMEPVQHSVSTPSCAIYLLAPSTNYPNNGNILLAPKEIGCSAAQGKRLADALAVLRDAALAHYAPPMADERARFEQVAAIYRGEAVKPRLPESARAYQVQAEDAVRDKDFDSAEELFGKALAIALWWPEGHYNRALVLAETGEYAAAVVEMQRYLELVPDANNARAAQDRIYEWQRKAPGAGGQP